MPSALDVVDDVKQPLISVGKIFIVLCS